jgi:hypothetical protein
MIKGRTPHLGFAVLMIAAIVAASVAWSLPHAESANSTDGDESCQFQIVAGNNLGTSVYVYLYDSKVRQQGTGVLFFWKQMKIQNHRIAPGKTMDRRYTADGRCSKNRQWKINVKRGSDTGNLLIETGGTSSTSRRVNLGPSSHWEPIY